MWINRRLQHTCAIALTLAIGATPLGAQTPVGEQLPDFGDVSGNLMTPAEEQRLGQAFMRSIRASERVIDDPLLTDYLQDLGRRLQAHSDAAGQSFSFFLIDDPAINAFAGPAGHIGVYTGLIETTETESELAAVLAHEIAHVTQQHLLRTWQAASNMSIPQAAILLAAVVLGATVGGDAGLAAAAAGQAGLIQQQLNFSRSNEQEADRVGIGILAGAEYEPRAMPSFFQRLGRATQAQASTLPEYLRTHPVTASRIADSLNRAETYGYKQRVDDLRFLLLRAALRERAVADPRQAVAMFERTLKDGRYRNESAERFGYVLALMRSRRLVDARAELDTLLRAHPAIIELLLVDAQLYQLAGKPEQAIASLRSALTLFPANYSLSVTLAEILLNDGQAQAAYALLKADLAQWRNEARVYEILARAADAIGRPAEGHEYLAENHYLRGELKPAILQLEIALRDYDLDFFDSSRVEARLRELREELEDLERRAS
jgi:predicted Zn-dependent protease